MTQVMSPSGMRARRTWAPLLMLLCYAAMVATYFVVRYGGRHAEGDSASVTMLLETVHSQGTVFPLGKVYPHGFAYQALSSMVLELTGLSTHTLQAIIWPLPAMIGLAAVAFVFYLQVTGERTTAALAALFLFLQGDMMFVTLRGSHEKLDWPLMLLALTLLVRSAGKPALAVAQHVILFYLVVFATMATNVFFASTFLVAVMLSLVLGRMMEVFLQRSLSVTTDLRRLVYVSLSCVVVFFIFLFNIYPPALVNLKTLQSAFDQVSATMLSFEVAENPYEYIAYGWIDRRLWFGLTLFTWLLIVLSSVEWLWQAKSILRGQKALTVRESLVWLFYAGFAIQVALAVMVDASGVLAANLQLRIFPGFTVLAVALLAQGIRRVLSSQHLPARLRGGALGLCVTLVAWSATASLFKATNEPLFSNKWGFYGADEQAAIDWFDDNAQNASVWTGLDERLRVLLPFLYAHESTNGNTYSGWRLQERDRYVLISERERLRGIRMELAMPPVLGWNQVYDNGDDCLYHRRPSTPYQR